MPTEIVTPLETVSSNIGLVVMDCIIFDSMTAQGLTQEARELKADIKTAMDNLSADELCEALYFYEKSTGKLGNGKTFMR